jgi:ubiquinone biosynthesis protein
MLWEVLSTARDIGRLHAIASVLIRYGFGDMVSRLGMAGVLERAGETLHWEGVAELARLDTPERVRRALEDLGTTFVKLGQILSTRVDLFPPEWIAEFEKLQDHAAPVPFDLIRRQIAEDLRSDPDILFDSLDPQPLAAGSIAQVHRARLHDGTEVVLKVRRPDIRPVVEADLRLLARLAEISEKESAAIAHFHPRALVQHFTLSLQRELDLDSECHNAERIAAMFADEPDIVVPRVYWQWTNERMNVQACIEGITGRNLAAVDENGLDRRLLARRGTQAVLKMVLEEGFFHADPHPGNVFYLPGNRLAFIDFGMVGRLTPGRRHQVVDLLYGIARREAEPVAELLLEWAGENQVNVDALALDISTFIDQFHGMPLERIHITRLLGELTGIMRRHHIALPPDLALLFKAVISLEGLGRMLDPGFDIVREAMPFLQRAAAERMSPVLLARQGARSMEEGIKLLGTLPRAVRRLLQLLRPGGPALKIDIPSLNEFADRLDRAASRLTMGIVTAALIIGSSIVMTVSGNSGWFDPSLLGLAGFIAAVVCGLWLVISMRRSSKKLK